MLRVDRTSLQGQIVNRQRENIYAVDVVLLPKFHLNELTAVLDVTRVADGRQSETHVSVRLRSPIDKIVETGPRLVSVKCSPVDFGTRGGLVVILGGADVSKHIESLASICRDADRNGRAMIILSDAVLALHKKGFSRNKTITIPWDDPYAEEVCWAKEVSNELLYIRSGKLVTGAGQLSAYEVMNEVVCEALPNVTPVMVADKLKVADVRTPLARQRRNLKDLYGIENQAFARAVELLENDLEMPLKILEISKRVDRSFRQLERLFRRTFGTSPVRFRRRKQIQKARWLIDNTGLSAIEISIACGFSSPSQLSKTFRQFWGKSPTEYLTKRSAMLGK